jgi:hypothetical protein
MSSPTPVVVVEAFINSDPTFGVIFETHVWDVLVDQNHHFLVVKLAPSTAFNPRSIDVVPFSQILKRGLSSAEASSQPQPQKLRQAAKQTK